MVTFYDTDLYDFQPVQSSLTFTRGGDSKLCKTVQIINDNFREEEQKFVVRLERESTYPSLYINPSLASVLISDDDGEGRFSGLE